MQDIRMTTDCLDEMCEVVGPEQQKKTPGKKTENPKIRNEKTKKKLEITANRV